jgi:hypothetical protein
MQFQNLRKNSRTRGLIKILKKFQNHIRSSIKQRGKKIKFETKGLLYNQELNNIVNYVD